MTEKTEWEVVDAPAQDRRQTPQQLMQNLLGRWWRWKIAGLVVVASLGLLFFLTFAAVFILGVMAVAIAALIVGKIRQWMHRRPGSVVRKRR